MLLELAGAPLPKPMHGRSLVPLFKDQARPWRSSFLAVYFAEERCPNVAAWRGGAQSERWKYSHYSARTRARTGCMTCRPTCAP